VSLTNDYVTATFRVSQSVGLYIWFYNRRIVTAATNTRLVTPFLVEAPLETPSVSPSPPRLFVKVPPLSKKTHFADPTMDSQKTFDADRPAPTDSPSLIDPASNFTGTLQLLPSVALSSSSSGSHGHRNLTSPHATFRNLFTARMAMQSQCSELDAAHEAANMALQQAETGRRLASEMELYLTQEMMRVVQVVQGWVSTVRIEQFSPDIEAEWATTWNRMATMLPPNLENSGAEYSKGGYVQPLDADDGHIKMESEE
jgi:hypothetical protein